MNDNVRGSFYMIISMAGFAVEDVFIKAAAEQLALGILLILFGTGGMVIFSVITILRGEAVFHRAALSKRQLIRSVFEVIGRLSFALAIVLSPLSSASAILQATPLVVVVGSIILFKEKVNWRQWTAIVVGFLGVMMIVRPGADSFTVTSVFALISTLGFAGRDLATRASPPALSTVQLGIYGFMMLIVCGLILHIWQDEPFNIAPIFNIQVTAQVAGAIIFGVTAYNFLTKAMRTGEISVVSPFRYVRLIFALFLGVIIFGENPDLFTLTGALIIVLSGIFLLLNKKSKSVHQMTRIHD